MSRGDQALAVILHEAGLSWSNADEVARACDSIATEGCYADDVAAALLFWRRKHARQRIAKVRDSCWKILRRWLSTADLAEEMHEEIKLHEDDPQLDFGSLDEWMQAQARLNNRESSKDN